MGCGNNGRSLWLSRITSLVGCAVGCTAEEGVSLRNALLCFAAGRESVPLIKFISSTNLLCQIRLQVLHIVAQPIARDVCCAQRYLPG
jgi:hypothetical protein